MTNLVVGFYCVDPMDSFDFMDVSIHADLLDEGLGEVLVMLEIETWP